ncbi:MAG: InlB B-repeat-containing protein [Oscillospiraceae bacterium]|nr:InlB B-repeat-containing protein [Oscillospiraceae bacterium]
MKKGNNGRKRWIPLLLCVCLFISMVLPFIPGVLAEEEETTEPVAADEREMIYPLACYTTQSSSQPPLAQEDTSISPYFWSVVSPSVPEPMEGYAYRFPTEGGYENFFYCRGDWYYLGSGTEQSFYGISIDPLGEPEADSFSFNEAIIVDPSKAIAVEDLSDQTPKTVNITWQNRVDDSISIETTERRTLTARASGFSLPSYQWQILLDHEANLWVNIADKTEANCEISYALVKNMLDASNSAYLRCAVREGAETVYSDPIAVTVLPEPVFDDVVTETDEQAYQPQEQAYQPQEPEEEHFNVFSVPEITERLRSVIASGPMGVGPDAETPPIGAGAEGDYVTITIKYLDVVSLEGSVEKAHFSPYTATILRGSEFRQSVASPSFLGFAPYQDSDGNGEINTAVDEAAETIVFDEDSVTADIEIKVYYEPILVDYAIRYYFQNVLDDLYTEDASKYYTTQAYTGHIVTSEELASHAGDTTGFTSLYHVPEVVAADGSTEFLCYYDRNYYLIQFDLDGGYGVDPVYARYESAFAISDPVRPGYVFDHWELIYIDENDNGVWDTTEAKSGINGLVSTIPVHNYYYRAVWGTVNTHYTTVYWIEHKDGSKEYLDYKTTTSVLSGSKVSGTNDYASLSTCSLETCAYGECPYRDVEHNHTLSCYTTRNLSPITNISSYTGLAQILSQHTPTEGYVYRYGTRSWLQWTYQWTYYNYFYTGGNWYDLGTSDKNGILTNYGITVSTLSNPTTSGKSTANSASLLSTCPATHVHDSSCAGLKYYKFDRADTGVTVMGDGSTIVNVYYKPREYTLRFYYARTTGTGTDADGDGFAEKFDTVEVIGGSSFPYGHYTTAMDTSDDAALLEHCFSFSGGANVGPVKTLPKLNLTGQSRNYTPGILTVNGKDYRYIEFTAEYGQNIYNLWPCSVFDSVKTSSEYTHNEDGINWKGDTAYVSAWNGEYRVDYTVEHRSDWGGNETIKGKIQVLDESLLFHDSYTDELTVSFICFWCNGANVQWSIPNLFVYHIWVPVLDGELTLAQENGLNADEVSLVNGLTVRKHEGVVYKLRDYYDTCDSTRHVDYGDTEKWLNNQTQPPLEGFSIPDSNNRDGTKYEDVPKDVPDGYYEAADIDFFYTRNKYELTMLNQDNTPAVSKTGGDKVLFETPLSTVLAGASSLSGANYQPPYPSTLEAGAYTFDGWYTSPLGIGERVNLATETMPASNLILYAKWVPVTHEVYMFNSYEDMVAYKANPSTSAIELQHFTVSHGLTIASDEAHTLQDAVNADEDMDFSGWFYQENGQKKAFAPLNMPITRDMYIFADWFSNNSQPYRISYVLASDHNTKIAEDTTGFAYAGTTRTFSAKVGDPFNQLYPAYNNGNYFPLVSSHSIVVQREAAEDRSNPKRNVYSFEYVQAEAIPYTIRYINKESGAVMHEVEHAPVNTAVVTERFLAFPNMVPDAFYKRLVLEVKDDGTGNFVGTENNVIDFYYIPNDTSAYYAVHFMLEKLDATEEEKNRYDAKGGGGYEETGTHIEGVGRIGTDVSIIPQSIAGFVPITDQAQVYDNDSYSRIADYEAGQFKLPVTANGSELYIFYRRETYSYHVRYLKYNADPVVSLAATKDVTGVPYGSTITETAPEIATYTCVSPSPQSITIQESTGTDGHNTITFYYVPNEYVVEYVPVTSDGGMLSQTREVVRADGTLLGATPTPNPNYRFDGWFKDSACTVPVAAADGTVVDNKLTPNLESLTPNRADELYANRFYAKFTKQAGNLTIVRTGVTEANQVFVYEVRNADSSIVMTVTITGSSNVTIHDLPLGEYTVTQQNGWSWRYSDVSQTVTHDGTTTVVFEGAATNQWLNGNSEVRKNIYEGGSEP